MIRHQQRAPILSVRHASEHRSNHFLVEIFDGLDFFLDIAHVARLVRCLDVDENEVVILQ